MPPLSTFQLSRFWVLGQYRPAMSPVEVIETGSVSTAPGKSIGLNTLEGACNGSHPEGGPARHRTLQERRRYV